MFGEAGGVNDEVNLRMLFVALPVADGVVDKIDARATLGYFVGANDFVEMDAHFGCGVGHGEVGEVSVLFQAAPVALVGKSLAAGDAERREDAPAADQTRLAGRKPNFLDGQQALVVKDVRVNQQGLTKSSQSCLLLYPKTAIREGRREFRNVQQHKK